MPIQPNDSCIYTLFADIRRYMDFLKDEKHLYVSVHQIDPLLHAFMDKIGLFNHHTCAYCMYMKSAGLFDICLKKQVRLSSMLGTEPFFGTCWAGMGEFVFPICPPGTSFSGIISISNYIGDAEKTRIQTAKLIERYHLPPQELQAIHSTLQCDVPDLDSLRVLIQPLVHMFILLETYLIDIDADTLVTGSNYAVILKNARAFLQNRYNTPYTLDEVAMHCGCSSATLRRAFRAQANCTYKEYLNRLRCDIAKPLLVNSAMDIQQISDHLGYTSSNYFSTVFRSVCGMSPNEYRHQQTGKMK